MNSDSFNGLSPEEAKAKITEFAGGEKKVTYKLRDWLVSRQRYWGAPIPIVYDPEGKPHPIPEEHLPWLLPTDVEFKPTGTSPLAESKELKERTEKLFGKGWAPEVDTMDTFVCSSWYYYRFADPRNKKEFASSAAVNQWLPVDIYVGGAEHTVLHLMYARFFTKALKRFGYIDFDEPFLKLRHQGTILGPDGVKMSKSRGNVVNPDEAVAQYGADTVRMYEMFLGPLADSKPWNPGNIIGIRRFLDRVWNYGQHWQKEKHEEVNAESEGLLHQTIRKVTEDFEELRYNTAIAALMSFLNTVREADDMGAIRIRPLGREQLEAFLKLLAPLAPHMAEELWHQIGNEESVHLQSWPAYDPEKTVLETIRLVLQVNGKVRDTVEAHADIAEDEAKALALKNEKVQKYLEGKEPKKIIVVPGKLVNIVI